MLRSGSWIYTLKIRLGWDHLWAQLFIKIEKVICRNLSVEFVEFHVFQHQLMMSYTTTSLDFKKLIQAQRCTLAYCVVLLSTWSTSGTHWNNVLARMNTFCPKHHCVTCLPYKGTLKFTKLNKFTISKYFTFLLALVVIYCMVLLYIFYWGCESPQAWNVHDFKSWLVHSVLNVL